jgi:hypothetical protein
LIAKPLDIQDVKYLTYELSDMQLGKHWIYWFKKHWPEVSYSRPRGLDLKQAQNFNSSNVTGFYVLLKAIYDTHPNLPPQHIWNMDEKRIQLSGGHKYVISTLLFYCAEASP